MEKWLIFVVSSESSYLLDLSLKRPFNFRRRLPATAESLVMTVGMHHYVGDAPEGCAPESSPKQPGIAIPRSRYTVAGDVCPVSAVSTPPANNKKSPKTPPHALRDS
jgi:hypothetical protein